MEFNAIRGMLAEYGSSWYCEFASYRGAEWYLRDVPVHRSVLFVDVSIQTQAR